MTHASTFRTVFVVLLAAPGHTIQTPGVEFVEVNYLAQSVLRNPPKPRSGIALYQRAAERAGAHHANFGNGTAEVARGHRRQDPVVGEPSNVPVTRHDEAFHTEVTDTSDAVSVMLLAMTTFFLSLFYMVNCPNKAVQGFTWSVMSQTISIFGAIFMWTAIKVTAMYTVNGQEEAEYGAAMIFARWEQTGHGGPALTIGSTIILFFILYIAFNTIIAKLWSYHVALEGFATLGANTLGFAGAEIMGTLCSSAPWNTSWILCLCFALMCGAVIFFMNTCTTWVRNRIIAQWAIEGAERMEEENAAMIEKEKEQKAHWSHVCQEAEHEWAACVGGMLVTLGIQFMITGELPSYHGNPYGKSLQETALMFVAAFSLAVLLVLAMAARERVKEITESEQLQRGAHAFAEFVSFSFGWCFLFACRFLYWASTDDRGLFHGDTMTARVVQAMALTMFTFAVILSLKGLADREFLSGDSAKVLMASFGLMLGLSWEGAFYQAIDNISLHVVANPALHVLLSDCLGLFISAVVLPAWAFFILPNALAAVEAIDAVH